MADDVATYEARPLNQAIGTGTIYTVLGVIVLVSLALTVIVGLTTNARPGFLDPGQAFLIGGVTIVVLSAAVLVLLFSLTGTIRYINREMEDLTRLRKAIEVSYARLAGATQNLGNEVSELRRALPTIRKVVEKYSKD